ncbi:dienelactone hydrolase family protein [Jannaschia ovalis]|uniref:Dienelactone hydrolase family protein n=1 Tax=Jannaschia ovalis TaxID=3038773 RepID=A0ABY8LDI1_9RHOB|nr:dienelactone hydrolase family protein [Jannaschia sp. GRR-S6-38]WGH78438.1 dienelactone hydrolase family protein [Jannaschia sp. GRR-S6-38]
MERIAPDGTALGAVLVIHSWWGLTDSFRDYGAALARQGFVVGLADLFDGRTARTQAAARALRAAPRRVPIYRRLEACLTDLRHAAPGAGLAVAGFSMGGHWAVWLAQRAEYDLSAAILYYAARGGDFGRSTARFLAHFAAEDPWVRPAARQRMERAIAAAGRPYRAFDYPDTGHWFAESARPADYRSEAARLALRRDAAFLRAALGPGAGA